MRSNKEFLEEIYARGQQYKTDRKRRIKAIILSAIPPIICVVLVAAIGLNANDVNLKRKAKSNKKSKSETVSYTAGAGEEEELIVEDTADTELLNDDIDGDYFLEDSKGEAAPNKGAAAAPQSSATSKDSYTNSADKLSANATQSQAVASRVTDTFDNAVELTSKKTGATVESTEVDEAFAQANTEFYLKLLRKLNKKGNTIFSPLSITNALGMTANGTNGKTRTEIESVIANGMDIEEFNKYIADYSGFNRSNKGITVANSVWVRDSYAANIKSDFLSRCKGIYKSQVFKTEFDSTGANKINYWINQKTNGKITKAVESLEDIHAMVLVNAVHFKANWLSTFSYEDVSIKKFTNADGSRVNVNMMQGTEYTDSYISGKNCTGFVKEYENNYSFVAILPNKGMDTNEFLNSITATELREILNNPIDATVDIAMPKFQVDYKTSLKSALNDMGMEKAFTKNADFSKMGNDKADLYIDDVIHNTTINVCETGTEASSSGSIMIAAGLDSNRKSVTLDRPFVYFIIDDTTKLPIFCGTINQMENAE